MKNIVKIFAILFVISSMSASSILDKEPINVKDGFYIKSIHVTKFPYGRNGKNFDKDKYPDLYVKLFLDHKRIGKSNVIKNAKKGRIPILSGGKMPFKIENNRLYHLQLLDHDSDKGAGSNRDEEISSKIKISWSDLVSKQGVKGSYLLKDPKYSDVEFVIIVEQFRWSEVDCSPPEYCYKLYPNKTQIIKDGHQYKVVAPFHRKDDPLFTTPKQANAHKIINILLGTHRVNKRCMITDELSVFYNNNTMLTGNVSGERCVSFVPVRLKVKKIGKNKWTLNDGRGNLKNLFKFKSEQEALMAICRIRKLRLKTVCSIVDILKPNKPLVVYLKP